MSEPMVMGPTSSADLDRAWSLACSALAFVGWLARDFAAAGVPREDLESEGRLGLLDAALRFDPDRGVTFATYASWWARRRMQAFVIRQARVVRRPETRGGPSAPVPRDVYLDDPVSPGRALTWLDVLEDGLRPHPLDALVRAEAEARVSRAAHELPPLWRDVVAARFGLEGGPPQTLAAIGERLGVSRERVRQIEAKAMARLREQVDGAPGEG